MSKPDDSEAEKKQVPAEASAESDPKPASEPASREDEDEDEQQKAPPKREPTRRRAAARAQSRPAPSAAGSSVPRSRVALFVIVALAAGGAAGWFGQIEQAKARVRTDSAATPAGSGAPSGPCGAWQSKVCDSAGEVSAICAQAKGATDLLTPSTCEAALAVMPATLTKIKAARKSCDSLVSKLCKDLPPGASACDMVKEKTPAFPSQRCDEMLEHYDEVLGSLRELEQQGGIPKGVPGGPGGPVMRPPGAVPGH
jgi:hypothetical protein